MKGTKMTTQKKNSVRSWMKEHSFELTASSVMVLMIAGLTYVAVKEQEAIANELEKQNNWEKSQLEQGNTIIEKDDHLYAVKVVSVY